MTTTQYKTTSGEVTQIIAKLRREMPRNPTAMALCEAAEQMLAAPKAGKPLTRAEIQRNYRERKKHAKSGECHSN